MFNTFSVRNFMDRFSSQSKENLELFKDLRFSDFHGSIPLTDLLNSFEVFFICFDEPNRRKHWRRVKKFIPHAKKIEGIIGFDKVLKVCAQQSATNHFFVIDGDNFVLESKLDQKIELDDKDEDWILSWSAQNSVNGLAYGNGGLKLWPKTVALNIKSHENAHQNDDPTDYCFVANYYQVNNFLTVTRINETAFQAFRAGFREGVKMSLVWGQQENLTRENYDVILGPENRERLWVWCNVGADVQNGLWSIYGARLGFKMNTIDMFDYKMINSYEEINRYWINKVIGHYRIEKPQAFSFGGHPEELYQEIKKLGETLQNQFGINMNFFSADDSEQFKESYKNPLREGFLHGKEHYQ